MLEIRTEVLAKFVSLVVPHLEVSLSVFPILLIIQKIAEGIGVLAPLTSKVLNTEV